MQMRETMQQSPTANWIATSLLVCLSALGFSSTQAAPSDDPPDRVARLSYLKGDVSLKPAGTDEWAPSVLNRPLTTDDQLSLDRNARAELQAGASVIQLDGGAAFSFSELSDNVLQARVTDGAIHLTVRRLQKDEVVEIDTPHAAITITEPGDYRIEVLDDGAHTLVKTYSGECQVAGNSESIRLQPREQVMLDESGQALADNKTFSPPDDFDKWAHDRNEQLSRSASSRYVAPDVIGYEDLDGYGEWSSAPDYGPIWYPRIAVGWSPYRDGHWAWVSPWGWTWVDNAPWGFAPFHYGRWAYVHSRWGWVPGPVHVRAVYAPALVAWVGGPSIGISVSFGSNVGWFPLGPREVYVPGYHCSPRHIHNVNYANTVIVNNTVINRAYVNRHTHIDYQHRSRHNAVTVVSRDTFVSARSVNNHRVHDGDVRGWRTHGASPAITPARASTLGPRWNGSQSHAPDRDRRVNREVMTRHSPPVQRASFEQEQRAVRNNNNRPIPRSDLWANARNATPRENGDSAGRSNHGRNIAGSNSGGTNNAGSIEHRSGGLFRNDHPRRVFDRAQEEMRPNAQAAAPSPSPRPDAQPRWENRSRPDKQPQIDTPQQAQREASRERNVFHSNNRMSGAQPESARPERVRPEQAAPRAQWPGNNSPRESQNMDRSRTFERSRPAESERARPQYIPQQAPQSQPRPEPQQQHHQQRAERGQHAAPARERRENGGRESRH